MAEEAKIARIIEKGKEIESGTLDEEVGMDESCENGSALPVGTYVTLYIDSVPLSILPSSSPSSSLSLSSPLVVFGMLQYENKLTVVHLR